MSVADLLAEHGSPLWLAKPDVVRDRQRSFTAAWGAEWPDVEIAYSHKANRLPAILRTLAEKGIGHQVACEAEYCLARSVSDANGRSIVVQGPAKPPALLDRAAADGALVIADTLAELRRLAAAGITRVGVRVGLPGVGPAPPPRGEPRGGAGGGPAPASATGRATSVCPWRRSRWPRARRRRWGCGSRRSPFTSCRPGSTGRWPRSRAWPARWSSSGPSRPSASPPPPRCWLGSRCAWACPSSTSAAASRPPRGSRPTRAP